MFFLDRSSLLETGTVKAESHRSPRTEYLAPPVVGKWGGGGVGGKAFMFCLTNLIFIQLHFTRSWD